MFCKEKKNSGKLHWIWATNALIHICFLYLFTFIRVHMCVWVIFFFISSFSCNAFSVISPKWKRKWTVEHKMDSKRTHDWTSIFNEASRWLADELIFEKKNPLESTFFFILGVNGNTNIKINCRYASQRNHWVHFNVRLMLNMEFCSHYFSVLRCGW